MQREGLHILKSIVNMSTENILNNMESTSNKISAMKIFLCEDKGSRCFM